MPNSALGNHEELLNNMSPTASRTQLGSMLQALIVSHNAVLAKLDSDGGVTDTNYAATLAVPEIPTA